MEELLQIKMGIIWVKDGIEKFVLQFLSFCVISPNGGITECLGHLLEFFILRVCHLLLSVLFLEVIDILFVFLLGVGLFGRRGALFRLHLTSTLLPLVPSVLHLRRGGFFRV